MTEEALFQNALARPPTERASVLDTGGRGSRGWTAEPWLSDAEVQPVFLRSKPRLGPSVPASGSGAACLRLGRRQQLPGSRLSVVR
jgi:hypothetical protein